jgi:carbon starvation protein CstA
LISIIILISAYFIYSKFCEKIFGVGDGAKMPSERLYDGVDYVKLPGWKIFMIQLLNIAGLGPIFGAIMGALFGPVVFLWIVLGCIFIGGAHDYISGMLSLRHDGRSVTEVIGFYLGEKFKNVSIVFIMVLSILVGVVFVKGPAALLTNLTGIENTFWFYLIFGYYIVATMFPIDKIIGKIYPVFAAALLIMALGLALHMVRYGAAIPEAVPSNLYNMHSGSASIFIYPMLFITVACGAVSGFHATQSPMMARCMTSERQGRPIFYGAMIAEGVIAVIWAAAAMAFFGGTAQLNAEMTLHKMDPAWLVNLICTSWLGHFGGALAVLGVVACPITTGDTAFRAARLIVADFFKFDQKPIKNRLIISLPIFFTAYIITKVNFDIIWRYFAWCNQTLSVIILWTCAVFLASTGRFHWIMTIPAVFMTAICSTYILLAPEGFKLSAGVAYPAGAITAGAFLVIFLVRFHIKPRQGSI